jgi:predicted ATP-grasp superfamily ATP-dependent carboligase
LVSVSVSSSRLAKWATQDRGPRPAVVLGQWTTGLSYVRSLHRRGVPTLLLTDRGRLAGPSRYELTLELPGIVEEPDAWLETLMAVAERTSRRPVLLVAFDHAVLFVGEHARELEHHYDFLIPPLETSSAIVDKHRQYELAAAAGIPIPRTFFAESGELAVAAGVDLPYIYGKVVRRLRLELHRREALDGRPRQH